MTKMSSPLIGRKNNTNKSSRKKHGASAEQNVSIEDMSTGKIDDWKDKIYSIAILLTGCADDAQNVVDEVMESLAAEPADLNETLETRVHRLAYDSALIKLLVQVDSKTSKLEEASNNILTASNFLS